VTIRVKVVPGSSCSEVVGDLGDGTLKVKVAAPPEKGKANDAVRELLAAHYGVPRNAVTIVSGHASPRKLVKIDL
jgi:uncharacterized protein (TIGR00251 family)